MLNRSSTLGRIRLGLRRNPVVALVGPRQCGKTTLARELVQPNTPNYFDLEDPVSLARLDQPLSALGRLRGLVVIDEIQRRPDLFPVLRVLADRKPLPARFLILGSASPELLRQSSETLAGRLESIELGGFTLGEVGVSAIDRHWLRGGFPRSFLARSVPDSFAWRQQYVQTLLERDLPLLGIAIAPEALLRFWRMLAHYHGNVWNAAEPARSLGVSEPTIRRYLDLLTGLFLVRQLQPWHQNLAKRQVKAPKVYVRDTGLLHFLLGIRTDHDRDGHPKSGASWEGYAIEQLLGASDPDQAYFWATHSGAELDLLLLRGRRRIGIEVKLADAPRMTPSIRHAIADLALDRVVVIYPGETEYQLDRKVSVVPLAAAIEKGPRLLA